MSDLLFSQYDLRAVIENQVRTLAAEVEKVPEDHVLHADVDAWVAALVEKYTVEAPQLAEEADWYQDDPRPTQVDVSHDSFMRAISDPSTPTYIAGHSVTAHLPFTGEEEIFECRPSSYTLNPPHAAIRGGEVLLVVTYPDDRPVNIGGAARELAGKLNKWLGFAKNDIDQGNSALEGVARRAVETRKQRILEHQAYVAATGLPTRKSQATKTYVADVLVRRPAPALPSAPLSQPMKLEPALSADVYEDVLGSLRSSAVSMERALPTYAHMDEESLRQVMLLPLNQAFHGQASAEAFNVNGKTDILLTWDGANLFIGECKWWSGQQGFTDALDQLFSYTAWRDTKLALIVFVRERGLTAIVEKARAALEEHAQFVEFQDAANEQELRARMSWPGDPDRHAGLNVFFVNLPPAKTPAKRKPAKS